MKNLTAILRQFEQKREKFITEGKWNEDAVVECFLPCAKDILCNGYFLINNEFVIDLGAIELYYHEEDGEIKDHIMYHTNERLPISYKKTIEKHIHNIEQLPFPYRKIKEEMDKYGYEKGGYSYFKVGSFNLHQSGFDVTFENEKEKYRASFLIRAYRILKKDDLNNDNILYDPCSSHLYDDISCLSLSNDIRIEWKERKGDYDFDIEKPCPRKNVAMYHQLNGKGKFEKDDTPYDNTGTKITKEDYDMAKKNATEHQPPIYFKYGNKYYKQDMRPWRFEIKGLNNKEIQ